MLSPRSAVSYVSNKISIAYQRYRCERASAVLGRDVSQTLIGRSNLRDFRTTAKSLKVNIGGKNDPGQAYNMTKFHHHIPSAADKKMLVWAKIYKSVEEVPKEVTFTQMRKARDMTRIRVNIGMAIATTIGCIIVIWYAKSKQGSGDSLHSRGLKWEREMQEKGRQEREERKAAEIEKSD